MTETAQPKRGGRAFHSILEPHFDFIRELRQRRKTWQEIAESAFHRKGHPRHALCPVSFLSAQIETRAKAHWEDAENHSEAPTRPPRHGRQPATITPIAIAEENPFSNDQTSQPLTLNRIHMNTNITKRIHINPQSKGSLGKSFEAEFRTAWLDYHGIQWNGSDLDDRHHSFADRHPEQVQSYTLGNDDDSKSTLLGLFRNVSRSDAPVHVIDCRAQADGLIVQALESLQLLESLAAQGIRFTFFLFPERGHREHE